MSTEGSYITKTPIYIFDLDGTLALIDHRRDLVEAPVCHHCNGTRTVDVQVTGEDGRLLSAGQDFCTHCKNGRDPSFKPKWDEFFRRCVLDTPNYPVVGLFQQLYVVGTDLRIWSGRSEDVRAQTIHWLYQNMGIQPYIAEKILKMRPSGDYTPDEQLKKKWMYALHPTERHRIGGIFDDRQKVVDMWRKEGFTCFQVAPGDF